MSDFDDLDDLLGPLRSAATPAELASEQDVVALMAANHASKGTTMFTSRRARVATLIAAGIIGFGGVAAAGPAAYELLEPEAPVEEPAEDPAGEPVEEPAGEDLGEQEVEQEGEEEGEDLGEQDGEEQEVVDEPGPAPADGEEPTTDEETTEEPIDLDDETTAFDENLCLEGNHGKTVSAAARGDLDIGAFTQRDVAQSSCGKTGDPDATETDDEIDGEDVEVEDEVEDETEVEEETEELVEKQARSSKGKSDQAPGKSGGKGAKKGG